MTDDTGRKQNGALAQLQSTDAIAYAAEMMKRYEGAGIKTTTDRERENAIIFGTNGSKVYNKIMAQMPVIQHSLHAYDQARGPAATIKDNENSPQMAIEKFNKALSDLGLILGQTVLPVLTPFVQQLTGLIKSLNEHPGLVKNLTLGFAGLAGALAFSGTLLTITNGFKAVSGAVNLIGGAGGVLALGAASPVVLGIAALSAALAGLAAGSWLKEKLDTMASKDAGHDTTWGGEVHDKLHGIAPFSPKPRQGRPDFVQPGYKRPIQVTTKVMLDKREIATAVTDVQAKELSRPATGGRSFDGSMMPRALGAH